MKLKGIRDRHSDREAAMLNTGMGGDSPRSEGPLAVGDPRSPSPLRIKDFPRAARFTARMVAMSDADPDWWTYNRDQRRSLARASRLHGDGRVRKEHR